MSNWSRWIRFRTLGSWLQNTASVRRNSVPGYTSARHRGISVENLEKSQHTDFNEDAPLMKALVCPISTYGCESWTLSKNEETRLDAFEMRGLRKILRVSRTAKKTNEWVLNKTGVKRELLDTIKARKLAYYGHTMRKQGVAWRER